MHSLSLFICYLAENAPKGEKIDHKQTCIVSEQPNNRVRTAQIRVIDVYFNMLKANLWKSGGHERVFVSMVAASLWSVEYFGNMQLVM